MTEPDTETIEYIDHFGRVERIDAKKRLLTVKLSDSHDCGGCPAARLCAAGKGSSEIEVAVSRPADFTPGMAVRLRGTERMHRRAIMLSTLLPCIFLVGVMTAVFLLSGSQIAAALSGILATAAFYAALYAFRDRVAHEFIFEASPAEIRKNKHNDN